MDDKKILEKLKKWIKKKEKDGYWTRDDDNGLLDMGKEICLDDLKEWIEKQEKLR